MIDPSRFNEDYFMFGPETGVSCYSRYRWMPELTVPMAMAMIDYLGITQKHVVVDFGCAFGYLVKAFRWLRRQAFGLDVSAYAMANLDPQVRGLCFEIDIETDAPYFTFADFYIAKDVFEHIPEDDLPGCLNRITAREIFAVIPLGEGGRFVSPANNLDITHVTCRTHYWWADMFEACGWTVNSFSYRVAGIKDAHYEKYPNAHGFFRLGSKYF